MNLTKSIIISGLSTFIRIVTSFIMNKIVAIYLGPSGIAVLGQLNNFINIIVPFSNAGIASGLVKYISENSDDKEEQVEYISSAIYISLLSSVIITFLIWLFSSKISILLFGSQNKIYIIYLFAISIIFSSLSLLLSSILNGMKKIKVLMLYGILFSILNLLISLYLIPSFKLDGALLSYIISPFISFIFLTIYIYKNNEARHFINLKSYNKIKSAKLLSFSLMIISTVLTSNISQIAIRKYIISYLSIENAGYWQSINRISDLYLMFITSTLSIYYLPRLSEIKDNFYLKLEIKKMYFLILPILGLTNIVIYFFRKIIISTVFTDKFLDMALLFPFQMVGDFFKISSWLLSFIMVAKAMTKTFIITELLFNIYYILFCILFVRLFDLIGLSYAYALSYIIYQIIMIYIFRSMLFKNRKIGN